MHTYVCKPLYKYQCVSDCAYMYACMCLQHQWTQMTQRGVLTQRRPSAGQTAGAAVNLVLLVQIQLFVSSESHLKLVQMFITWQWRCEGSHLSLQAPEYQVWHSDRDYEYLTAQRGSGEVQWSRARWRHERSGSAGPPVRSDVGLSCGRASKASGWMMQRDSSPWTAAVQMCGSVRFRLPVRSLMIRLERMMMMMLPRTA